MFRPKRHVASALAIVLVSPFPLIVAKLPAHRRSYIPPVCSSVVQAACHWLSVVWYFIRPNFHLRIPSMLMVLIMLLADQRACIKRSQFTEEQSLSGETNINLRRRRLAFQLSSPSARFSRLVLNRFVGITPSSPAARLCDGRCWQYRLWSRRHFIGCFTG
jgi:hypothetical protein